jgi:hypothetical protein
MGWMVRAAVPCGVRPERTKIGPLMMMWAIALFWQRIPAAVRGPGAQGHALHHLQVRNTGNVHAALVRSTLQDIPHSSAET